MSLSADGGSWPRTHFPYWAAIIRESSCRTGSVKVYMEAFEAAFSVFAFPKFGFLRIK